ncbi:MAG: hypothetical protein ACYDHD_00700 [Vulcanimicrobiaceae bacterium]
MPSIWTVRCSIRRIVSACLAFLQALDAGVRVVLGEVLMHTLICSRIDTLALAGSSREWPAAHSSTTDAAGD